MEIRTIVEITCVLGFAVYFLWSLGTMTRLATQVCVKTAAVASQQKEIDAARARVRDMQAEFIGFQNKTREKFREVQTRIAAMGAKQAAQ